MNIDTSDMIEVTGLSVADMLRAAYALSSPKGLGFLHAKPGELDQEVVDKYLDHFKDNKRFALSTDYVLGRAVKFNVWRGDNDTLWIDKNWFDHSAEDLAELLTRCGAKVPFSLVR